MKIVIIEDEQLAAEDLHLTLKQIDPTIQFQAILPSVAEAVQFFSSHPFPDLIFSDIQLGDGLSFEIFQQVSVEVPIIFCTAFDSYAIEAFRTSGIDYVLKPYDEISIKMALQKFSNLKSVLARDILQQFETIKQTLNSYRLNDSGTFMIRYRDRHLPVSLDKIGLFYLENDVINIYLLSGKIYFMPNSLEEVEKQLNHSFFRVNRQCIVNRNAIDEIREYFPRRLKIILNLPFENELIVSKEKKTKLLNWLKK